MYIITVWHEHISKAVVRKNKDYRITQKFCLRLIQKLKNKITFYHSNLTARLCPWTENVVLTPEATVTFCEDSMYGQLDDSVTVWKPHHTHVLCHMHSKSLFINVLTKYISFQITQQSILSKNKDYIIMQLYIHPRDHTRRDNKHSHMNFIATDDGRISYHPILCTTALWHHCTLVGHNAPVTWKTRWWKCSWRTHRTPTHVIATSMLVLLNIITVFNESQE